MTRAKALTIAGSDCGGGAGIQADLKTFQAHGVYGASVITAITAQNTCGVQRLACVDPELVTAQMDAVLTDIGADAIKIGMLGGAQQVSAVAAVLRGQRHIPLVVDPVLRASDGSVLTSSAARDLLKAELLPLATLITPNLPEAGALLNRPLTEHGAMFAAAYELQQLGAQAVLLKGGHLTSAPVDVLYTGTQFIELHAERIATPHTHGTGCTYAAAITALLAQGVALVDAVQQAHAYLQGALRHAERIGAGTSPVNHQWRMR